VENHPAHKEDSPFTQAQNNADGRRISNWLVSVQEDGGKSIHGLDDMIDWVTSVVAGGNADQSRSSQMNRAELDRAICEWYNALVQCYSSQASVPSVAEHGAAVAAFKRAELKIRKSISKREDRELLLYGMRWVGANDGEAARNRAWWCEPHIVTASGVSKYLRRPQHIRGAMQHASC
jgi:hypothetical protein